MGNKECVLIVEDDNSVRNFISTILVTNGYSVLSAGTGVQALSLLTSNCPDIVLLDLGLPDVEGMKLLKTIREWSDVPVIIVSARDRERDKIQAFDAGADDYVTKPFGTGELLARMRNALRHKKINGFNTDVQDGNYTCGDLKVDFDKHRVFINGNEVHLTLTEYKLIALLSRYSGKVLTYNFIIKNIWGPYAKCDNQILRVNMANLRRKVENDTENPRYLFTQVGVGYRIAEKS